MKTYRLVLIIIFAGMLLLIFYGCSGDSKIQQLNDKPADKKPLVGMVIHEGIKLVGPEKTYIVKITPKYGVTVYPTPDSAGDKIIIDKSMNKLYLYKKGELYKIYPVATGKDPRFTPEGNFKIVNKIENYGQESNPQLGVRWMGLSVPRDKDKRAQNDKRAPAGHKYGTHGTNEPESIGKHASGGCIRMHNKQVSELFALVEKDTPVIIR